MGAMASKQSATSNTPPSAPSEGAVPTTSKTAKTQAAELNALFMTMALQMSWQLALVVIVPLVGGYMLDGHYHTAPWLLIAGVLVAVVGVFGVLQRVLSEANRRANTVPNNTNNTKGAA